MSEHTMTADHWANQIVKNHPIRDVDLQSICQIVGELTSHGQDPAIIRTMLWAELCRIAPYRFTMRADQL